MRPHRGSNACGDGLSVGKHLAGRAEPRGCSLLEGGGLLQPPGRLLQPLEGAGAITTSQLQGVRPAQYGAEDRRLPWSRARRGKAPALAFLVERPGSGLLEGLPRPWSAGLGATVIAQPCGASGSLENQRAWLGLGWGVRVGVRVRSCGLGGGLWALGEGVG